MYGTTPVLFVRQVFTRFPARVVHTGYFFDYFCRNLSYPSLHKPSSEQEAVTCGGARVAHNRIMSVWAWTSSIFACFYISSSDRTVAVTAQHGTATSFYHEHCTLEGGKLPSGYCAAGDWWSLQ